MKQTESLEQADITRYGNLSKPGQVIFILQSLCGIGFAVVYIFGITIAGSPLQQWTYYYLLVASSASAAYLVLPGRKKDKMLPWYDMLASAAILGICIYFSLNSTAITWGKWATPSGVNFYLALVLTLLVMEGARRAAGWIFLVISIVFGSYPLFAGYLPGILGGRAFDLQETIGSLVFTPNGLMGLPTTVLAETLIGFLLFAGFLIACGGGDFFLKMSLALLGRYRGGPAKVAVISSGFFGSLSGSTISNIVATGSITIPTMKRMGYPAHYAGAIETCASTGGAIMPPVMGAVAFIAAQLLGLEYSTVVVAAIIPALLYYFGLAMQVDAYAAKAGLKGLPLTEIPPLWKTLAEGWHFIAVMVYLLVGLLYMRLEEITPFYATVLLVVFSMFRKTTRITPRRFVNILVTTGKLLAQTMALILPIGFVLNGLIITGVSGAFSSGLVHLGGDNLVLVLLLGVVACFIMGMSGLVVEAYLFLAITLAPALIEIGDLNPLAVHMFLIYYSNLGMITPPVALASFVGATVANADPMKTALKSMTLGIVLYFIPFFFLFNPSLILQGDLIRSAYVFGLCLVGIALIAGGLEGYVLWVGRLSIWARPLLVAGGFLICLPEMTTSIVGAGICTGVIIMTLLNQRGGAKVVENEK